MMFNRARRLSLARTTDHGAAGRCDAANISSRARVYSSHLCIAA